MFDLQGCQTTLSPTESWFSSTNTSQVVARWQHPEVAVDAVAASPGDWVICVAVRRA